MKTNFATVLSLSLLCAQAPVSLAQGDLDIEIASQAPVNGTSLDIKIASPTCLNGTNLLRQKGIFPAVSPEGRLVRRIGINCRGSLMCPLISWVNICNLKTFVDDIDDGREWGNHDYVACAATVCPLCSSSGWNGGHSNMTICVFPQGLETNETVTAKTVKEKVNKLVDHGCTRCGSVPLHEGKDKKAEITINYVTNGCGEGICP